MRKIVLSRKGFDSGNANIPSAFVRDGEMVSFPIPASDRADLIRYGDIRAEGISMRERIEQLVTQGEGKIFPHERCHHDPDLVRDARVRPSTAGWRGVFGQSGIAFRHLDGGKVGENNDGDLFLFFGWFKEAKNFRGELRFIRNAPDLHVLFGYLQIERVLNVTTDEDVDECFNDHPHVLRRNLSPSREAQQTGGAYIARERLWLPGAVGTLPGWGVFRHAPELVLTEPGRKRSFWELPDCFDGQFRDGYIRVESRVEREGQKKLRCNTQGQWQESIVNATPEIQKWASGLIRRNHLRS